MGSEMCIRDSKWSAKSMKGRDGTKNNIILCILIEIGGRGFSELSVFFESFVFSELCIVGKSADGISGSDE